jgi:hypothetical protein
VTPAVASPPAPATVSRAAFFLGLGAGIGAVLLGFFGVPLLSLPDWAADLAELASVAVAMALAGGIWKRSARANLDTPAGDR